MNIKEAPGKREWFRCPVCGAKLMVYDSSAESHGVYIKCKNCRKVVEIKIAHK